MDPRLSKSEGLEAYTGNELLIKGALEAGVGLITGYPGSPIAQVFDVASSNHDLLQSLGVTAQMANNEALAAARLNGSQMADIRAVALMKSVGFHVAADGLALGNLAKTGRQGGALVVVGDDPWSETTQVPVDSRRLSDHLFIPILEPSNFQELKDWMDLGLTLSAEAETFILYLVTSPLADGGSAVRARPNKSPQIRADKTYETRTADIRTEETVLLPPRTGRKEVRMLREKWPRLLAKAREMGLSRIEPGESGSRLGFVASGMSYTYLRQALSLLGLEGRYPILRLGLSFPLDRELLREFALQVGSVVVVEEKRRFLEEKIKDALTDCYQEGLLPKYIPVWGKKFPGELAGFPEAYGLNPSIVMERLGALVLALDADKAPRALLEEELRRIRESGTEEAVVPLRSPTFCPGCPHRDSSSVFIELRKDFGDADYMRRVHKRGRTDLVFHGDTGCYTMYMFEPNQDLMHNYSGMGLGGGTGAGIDAFIANKQVVFMGDSTFFHSGMSAVSDAVKHGQDITFVILENKTTAMTGHQPTPGMERNLMEEPTFSQNIELILRGMTHEAGIPVIRANPEDRFSYRQILEETVLKKGVKVVIADKECGITFHRRVRADQSKTVRELGFLPFQKFIHITPEVCENCLECTRITGCPGLETVETPYGSKIQTSRSTCVSDGACARIKACPSFEEVTVERASAPETRVYPGEDARPRDPSPLSFTDVFSTYISGVGGMGNGVITAILVRAGLAEGLDVQFCEKMGLAIRNGGVYSHVIYAKPGQRLSPIIPYGRADLLIGIDHLEAARAMESHSPIRVMSRDRTRAIVNSHKNSTVRRLTGKDDWSVDEILRMLGRRSRPGEFFSLDASAVCEEVLGSSLYANMLLLGAAFQKGWIPVSVKSLESALEQTLPKRDLAANRRALSLGRLLADKPDWAKTLLPEEGPRTLEEVVQDREKLLGGRGQRYREEVFAYCGAMAHLAEGARASLALRAYDLVRWGGFGYARVYLDSILGLYRKDRLDLGLEATEAAISGLAKAMLIKDEVYVSYLLTSAEKRRADLKRYRLDPSRGDRISSLHLNRPEFSIFGRDFAFNISTRDWMLRIMRRAGFLRALLPGWHRREKAFRSWYLSLVKGFRYQDKPSYGAYVRSLRLVEEVRGYRKIRYPKMEEVIRRAGEILRETPPEPRERAAGGSRV